MTIDPRFRDDASVGRDTANRRSSGPNGSFPEAWVVQLVSGDATSSDALVAELVPCAVTVSQDRIVARDDHGEEWSWFAADLDAVVHAARGTWTIFDVPGISDFGVAVAPSQVDDFRAALERLRGVEVRFQRDVPWSAPPAPVAALEPSPPVVPHPVADRTAAPADERDGFIRLPEPAAVPWSPVPVPPLPVEEVVTARQPVVVVVPPVVTSHVETAQPVGVPSAGEAVAPSRRRQLFGRRQVAQSVDEIVSWPGGLTGIDARNISAWFGSHKVLDRVSLQMQPGKVTSLIGPSGCGKSTFLRILNRMHEMIPGAQMDGEVIVDGHDIYDPERKLTDARREVGMVFQKPNPFPAMSIYDNVLASLQLTGVKATAQVKDELVESCLMKAGLWNEVKDRLRQPGGGLSGGQQQRLCIARALSIRPRVLLMDEPCSALDPTSTRRIEETIIQLVSEVTIVIVTHNMQQAARVSDHCAFFLAEQGTPGVIVEHGPTDAMFEAPQDPRTFDYVNGRFG
jgi:phosphate transport system ATP-binding protein